MTDVDQTHEDIAACDRALNELVSAIVAHDADRAARPRPDGERFKLVPFKAVADLDRMGFEALTKDPVRAALREGVKRIGREIHRLGGGTGGMLDSLAKVVDLDPANAGRRGAIMDSAFNGIGTGDDRWWS